MSELSGFISQTRDWQCTPGGICCNGKEIKLGKAKLFILRDIQFQLPKQDVSLFYSVHRDSSLYGNDRRLQE